MAATIRDVLAEWPRPVFVVLDGAHFPDLPTLLQGLDIQLRPLYLERDDNVSLVRAGPFLAELDEPRLDELLAIPDITKAAVFWRADWLDAEGLYQHLRRLNLVEIPGTEAGAGLRSVVFRHWDPAVQAVTLPVMTREQRAALFGKSDALAIVAPEGVLQAQRRPDWPEPARGRLVFDARQMQALAAAMGARSHRAISAYLRDSAPNETHHLDDAALLGFVRESEVHGRALGLRTEQGLGQFAYLMLVTRGEIAKSGPASTYLRASEGGADQAIARLLMAMSVALRERGIA